MSLRVIAAFALCLLSSVIASAVEPDEQLDELLTHIQTLEASVVQTSAIESNKNGVLLLKKPNRLKLHINSPVVDEQFLVADGEMFYAYHVDFEQVVIQPLEDSPLVSIIAGLPMGNNFIVTVKRLKAGYREFILQSKAYEADLPSAKLLFNKLGKLRRLSFVDPFGGLVDVNFSKIKLNKPLSDELFHFQIPEGVDDIIGL